MFNRGSTENHSNKYRGKKRLWQSIAMFFLLSFVMTTIYTRRKHYSTQPQLVQQNESGTVTFSVERDIRDFRERRQALATLSVRGEDGDVSDADNFKILQKLFDIHRKKQIQGWVDFTQPIALSAIADFHRSNKVSGDIAEIGVHHGLFLLYMSCFLKGGEKAIAIDLFETKQNENVDSSGHGRMTKLLENLDKVSFPSGKLKVIKENSLRVSPEHILEKSNGKEVRIFSVDGGHSFETTLNDLVLASKVLHPKGVIIVDDFINQGWMGVPDAVFTFLNVQSQVAAFLWTGNKVYICRREVHAQYLELVKSVKYIDCVGSRKKTHVSRKSIGGSLSNPLEICIHNTKGDPFDYTQTVEEFQSFYERLDPNV